MNTLALLTSTSDLKSSDPDILGGFEAVKRTLRMPQTALASGSDGAAQMLKQTVGIRLACSTVVRWYHGGINE